MSEIPSLLNVANVSVRLPPGADRANAVNDVDLVLRLAREHEVLVTIEEGAIGGFGTYVLQTLAENGVLDRGLKVRMMVLPDTFIDQDSPNAMYAKAGLDTKGIVAKVFEALGREKIGAIRLA